MLHIDNKVKLLTGMSLLCQRNGQANNSELQRTALNSNRGSEVITCSGMRLKNSAFYVSKKYLKNHIKPSKTSFCGI